MMNVYTNMYTLKSRMLQPCTGTRSVKSPVQLPDENAMQFPFHVIDLLYQASERSKHAKFQKCDEVQTYTYMADIR